MKTENRLSRETVADAALALADAEGLEAVTIRRLAQRLGVTPMALYWHFKNKDELLDGVVDRLWARIDLTRELDLPLIEQFRALLTSLVSVLRAHRPAAALVATGRGAPGGAFADATETALAILDELGYDAAGAAAIAHNALRTVTALVLGEPGAANPQESPEQNETSRRRKRLILEGLPESRYPHVVRAAEYLTSCSNPDIYYDFGLNLFIAGVTTLDNRM